MNIILALRSVNHFDSDKFHINLDFTCGVNIFGTDESCEPNGVPLWLKSLSTDAEDRES
jgi:hypothetical protein